MGDMEQKDYYDYTRRLCINKENGVGRRLEAIDGFQHSYFRDNYYDALALTMEVVERNQQIVKNREECGSRKFRKIGQEKLYNIITFCGERGVGKTSVMDSFISAIQYEPKCCDIFINEYENKRKKKNRISQEFKNCEFICLDQIDASLLEESEDILNVIFSKMFEKLYCNSANKNKRSLWGEGREFSNSRSVVQKKFDEVYRNRANLKRSEKDPYKYGESALELMHNLAGSLGVRENIKDLVEAFLAAWNDEECPYYNMKNRYLVISIDDLDMHKDAYEMLEQIHRYLMIPHVIIYLAMSEREIQSVCKSHFKGRYNNSDELTMSYLEKVLPYSQRIHLPVILNGNCLVVTDTDELEVKDYFLRKIARRTRVFYDGCGLKTHFYEIRNLRTLINLYYYLDAMEKPDEEITEKMSKKIPKKNDKIEYIHYFEILDSNIEKLKNDVVSRMATHRIKEVNNEIFLEYNKEDVSRKGDFIVEYIFELLKENEQVRDYIQSNYNYGNLMGSLYILGRTKREYKSLVQCILALSTIELTQIYMHAFLRDMREPGKDSKSMIKWKECISGSVCGNWGNQMIPAIKNQHDVIQQIAYFRDNQILRDVLADVSVLTEAVQESQDKDYDIFKNLLTNKGINFVKSIELFMMYMTESVHASDIKILLASNSDLTENINKGLWIGPDELELKKVKRKDRVRLDLKISEGTFDFLGFVIHSMDYEAFFKSMHEMVYMMLENYVGQAGKKFDREQLLEFKGIIKQQSMYKEYQEWFALYKGMALPMYSTDIIYNVLKRTKKRMNKELPEHVEEQDFLTCMDKVYNILWEALVEEDKFYGNKGGTGGTGAGNEKDCHTQFGSAFLECPFIKWFGVKSEFFTNMFHGNLARLAKDEVGGGSTAEEQ